MYLKKIFIIFIFLLASNIYSETFSKGSASIAVKKPNKITAEETAQARKH